MGTFWNIQTFDAWKNAMQLGYLIGNKEYIWPEFIDAYHWMMKQMNIRFQAILENTLSGFGLKDRI